MRAFKSACRSTLYLINHVIPSDLTMGAWLPKSFVYKYSCSVMGALKSACKCMQIPAVAVAIGVIKDGQALDSSEQSHVSQSECLRS